jgi:integrase
MPSKTMLGHAVAPVPKEPLVIPANAGEVLFGTLAEIWKSDYVERVVGGKPLVSASTRGKYRNHLRNHILPKWASTPIGQLRSKLVLDWLQQESGSWFMMTDLRNIMSGIFTKAQEWEILPDTFANPITRVKLPKKWQVYEKRILSEQETVRVFDRLRDPNRIICEICIGTGARISEVTGLQVKHINLDKACIRIEQRHWRGDIDDPKTERSKRTLTLGRLVERLRDWISALPASSPQAGVFLQDNPKKPMWDSGVRKALKDAAKLEGCDFPGFGLHSLRRANITWRQEVGGSSIEASRIAGHASTRMTEEYTVVQLNRQAELTWRIQEKVFGVVASVPQPAAVAQNYLALPAVQSDESILERSHTMAKKPTGKQAKRKNAPAIEVREGSKKAKVIQMLQRPEGATLEGLMKATGWQAHSVRGFLSATVGKQMGLKIDSSKRDDGQRLYRIA